MSIVAKYLEQKELGHSLKEKLLALSKEDQFALGSILSLLPSANNLQEILELASEIASREQSTLSQVLGEKSLQEIALDEKDSKKNRLQRIKLHLERMRYPLQHALLKELDKCKKEIAAQTGLNLNLPKDLEGDALNVTIKFTSSENCKELAGKLALLSELEATKRIFSILRGEF